MDGPRLKVVRKEKKRPSKIMIAAMPWANPETPSIQVAVLKKYLSDRQIPITAGHWYLDVALDIGFDAYSSVSLPDVSAGETLYSYLLFPEMRDFLLRNKAVVSRAGKIEKSLKVWGKKQKIRFRWSKGFFREFEAIHRRMLDRYCWEDYALVGFTLNYGQTVASLYMAGEIKKRNPACKIIFGGAEASGELGASLVENFPQLDYACNGEGEIPFYELSKAILEGASESEIRNIGGITCQEEDGGVRVNSPRQIESLDDLETPEYDDYFEALEHLGHDSRFFIRELPIEASRGCPFSCNFCSLNLQWENFRSRSPEKVSEDIWKLSRKYRVLGFRFMDNILPRNSEKIFEKIAKQKVDYRFFYEIRAQTPPRVLRLMKKAGAGRLQCGVEALSTSLLKKFNKKSKFIHNLQAMKLFEELGVDSRSGLITDYPLSSREELEETIRNMEYCLAYQPLIASTYTLAAGSPDYEHRGTIGFRSIRNADVYRYIYPPHLFKRLNLIGKHFRSSGPRPTWKGVSKALRRWEKLYREGKHKLTYGQKSLLPYFDGGTFLQIDDFRGRSDGSSVQYLLDGIQREVYLFAEEIRPWNAFREAFSIEEAELRALLRFLVDHKLMYEEDDYYLSLAMNADSHRASEASLEPRVSKTVASA